MILNLYKWWGCHQRNIIWLFFNSLLDIQWKFSTINNSYRTIDVQQYNPEGGWNKIIIIILPLTIWSTMNFKLNLENAFLTKDFIKFKIYYQSIDFIIYCIIGWVNICINSFTSRRYWWRGWFILFFPFYLYLAFKVVVG